VAILFGTLRDKLAAEWGWILFFDRRFVMDDKDKEVLRRRLAGRAAAAVDQAMAAVERAPDGQWIAASEWRVREVFQQLMAESFQEILQARVDAHPAAAMAAFSPCGEHADPARQGGARPPGGQRRG